MKPPLMVNKLLSEKSRAIHEKEDPTYEMSLYLTGRFSLLTRWVINLKTKGCLLYLYVSVPLFPWYPVVLR